MAIGSEKSFFGFVPDLSPVQLTVICLMQFLWHANLQTDKKDTEFINLKLSFSLIIVEGRCSSLSSHFSGIMAYKQSIL